MGNNRGSQTGGQRAKIKNHSHENLLKETEPKSALTGSTVGQKAQRLKKGKTLTLCSNLKLQKDVMSGVMRSMMNENQKSQSQVHVTV